MDIEDRNLVGIEYPGRVENVDNMIKTIGGLTNLSKVVCIQCIGLYTLIRIFKVYVQLSGLQYG